MPDGGRAWTRPPKPSGESLRAFGLALRRLRTWAGLTQKALERAEPALSDATISDHERGLRLPRYEWVVTYVVACLRHREPDIARTHLIAELERWRTAWTSLHQADPAPPVAPAQDNPPATQETTSTAPETSYQQRTRRLRPLISLSPAHGYTDKPGWLRGQIALTIIGALISAGLYFGVERRYFPSNPPPNTPRPSPPRSTPATPAPRTHAAGSMEKLRDSDGIDLDTGTKADENMPGVDISFSSSASHLDAMSTRVSFTLLPTPVAPEKSHCQLAREWNRSITTIRELTEGRNICVKTDEGRLSMITFTARPNATPGTVSFRYLTWS